MSHGVFLEQKDFDTFLQTMKDEFRHAVATIKTESIEKPMTRSQAAKYLQVNVDTLDRYFRDEVIPIRLRHQIGGQPRFYASELQAYIKKS